VTAVCGTTNLEVARWLRRIGFNLIRAWMYSPLMIVGGNIDGVTRVMTTAIGLETSKGDPPLALSLGIVLITLVLALNAAAYGLKETAQPR